MFFKKADFKEKSPVLPSLQNSDIETSKVVKSTQSKRDTLTTLMKRNKNFFTEKGKPNGSVFWNGTLVKPQGGNIVRIENRKYIITLEIQKVFIDTTHSTNILNQTDKLGVNIMLKSPRFYPTKQTKEENSNQHE